MQKQCFFVGFFIYLFIFTIFIPVRVVSKKKFHFLWPKMHLYVPEDKKVIGSQINAKKNDKNEYLVHRDDYD